MPDLHPALTLDELLGPGHVYCPRASLRACRWLGTDAPGLDALAAARLPIAGQTPVVCSMGSLGPQTLAVLTDAGFTLPVETFAYRDETHRVALTRELAAQGYRMVVDHVYPADELAAVTYWIDPALLRRLNNKGALAEFVPAAFTPDRQVVDYGELADILDRHRAPVMLKAATDESSGGGVDTAVYRPGEAVGPLLDRFAGCDQVVIETRLAIRSNLCLNYAIARQGEVHYLGCSRQVTGADGGRFLGNQLEAGLEPPSALHRAATDVIEHARRLGYYGFAGIDAAITDDGELFIYDLNFRANASTLPLLMMPALRAHRGARVAHSRYWQWTGNGGFPGMLRAVSTRVRLGGLLPFSLTDTQAAGHGPTTRHRLGGMLYGHGMAELQQLDAWMAAQGLS